MVSRIIGFFYRIFLSHTIGAEQLGIFQLVSPVYSMALAVCSAGIQTSLSRFIAAKTAEKDKTSALHFLVTGTVFSFLLALVSAFLLYYFSVPVGTVFLGEPRTIPLLQVMACSILCPSSIPVSQDGISGRTKPQFLLCVSSWNRPCGCCPPT